jgi:hypothetical protein
MFLPASLSVRDGAGQLIYPYGLVSYPAAATNKKKEEKG